MDQEDFTLAAGWDGPMEARSMGSTLRKRRVEASIDEEFGGTMKVEMQEDPKDQLTMRQHNALRTKWNLVPILLLLCYLGSGGFYFYIRLTKTLVDGSLLWYSVFLFSVECLGVTALLPYALLLVISQMPKESQGLPAARNYKGHDSYGFHVRVLIPCYKEDLSVVGATVKAALEADLPPGASRTVYLCDDGKDEKKREFVTGCGSECVYVTGRVRLPGEINGKSSNLNNCLKNVIYERYQDSEGQVQWHEIPLTEVVVVFDADMICKKNFFLRTLEVMTREDIALCLTPQSFHNINRKADLFNNINLQFWEYWLPGASAWGYIACTGTNFLIRASPLAHCGFFPTYTITEDYALGMELKMKGYRGSYLLEYLAVGEAPDEVRNVMRQRSRWTKGHMQVFFSWQHCPLLLSKLSLPMKLWYTYGTWAYFTTVITIPSFMMVPFLSLAMGLNPILINWWFALAGTIYYTTIFLIQSYCRRLEHLKSLWFANISNTVLWFTYFKAVLNVLLGVLGLKGGAGFKATEKKAGTGPVAPALLPLARAATAAKAVLSRMASLAAPGSPSAQNKGHPEIWPPASEPSTSSKYPVVVQGGPSVATPLNVTVHISGLLDKPEPKPELKEARSKKPKQSLTLRLKKIFLPQNVGDLGGVLDPLFLIIMFSFCCTALGIGLWRLVVLSIAGGRVLLSPYAILPMLWAFYNAIPSYLFIHYCFTAGKSFKRAAAVLQLLSSVINVAAIVLLWRSIPRNLDTAGALNASVRYMENQANIVIPEKVLLPNNTIWDVTGGWNPTGDAVKFVMPLCTSMTVMALGLREFGAGYTDGERQAVSHTLRTGADYLLKLFVSQDMTNPMFIAQVGDPRDYHIPMGPGAEGGAYLPERNALQKSFVLDKDKIGSDLLASAAAALAATSVVISHEDQDYAGVTREAAEKLYQFARMGGKMGEERSYCDFIPCKDDVPVIEKVMAVPVKRSDNFTSCWVPEFMEKTCTARNTTQACLQALKRGNIFKRSKDCCSELEKYNLLMTSTTITPQGVCALPEGQLTCWIPSFPLRTCLAETIDTFTGMGCRSSGTKGGVFATAQECCNHLWSSGGFSHSDPRGYTVGVCGPPEEECYMMSLKDAKCIANVGTQCRQQALGTSFPTSVECCNALLKLMGTDSTCEVVNTPEPVDSAMHKRRLMGESMVRNMEDSFVEGEAGQPEVLPINRTKPVSFYESTSVLDDLSWAGVWLYLATDEPGYLGDAQEYLKLHLEKEGSIKGLAGRPQYYIFNWDNQVWGSLFLLTKLTDLPQYHMKAREFLRTWVEFKPPERDEKMVATWLALSRKQQKSLQLEPLQHVVEGPDGELKAYTLLDQCVPEQNTTKEALAASLKGVNSSLGLFAVKADPLAKTWEDKCDDGIDNDCDGLVDEEDPDCYFEPVKRTRDGLAWTKGSPLPSVAQTALLGLLYSRTPRVNRQERGLLRCWALGQVRYIQGENSARQSYLVGVGNRAPMRVQDRWSSCRAGAQKCTWRDAFYPGLPNPQLDLVRGALVGGPDRWDKYIDDRRDGGTRVGVMNTVGFSSALAALKATHTDIKTCGQLHGLYQEIFEDKQL